LCGHLLNLSVNNGPGFEKGKVKTGIITGLRITSEQFKKNHSRYGKVIIIDELRLRGSPGPLLNHGC
jgi:hypothetical protein